MPTQKDRNAASNGNTLVKRKDKINPMLTNIKPRRAKFSFFMFS